MANLAEQSQWEAGIYQLEETDPVHGGPPNLALSQGFDNVPHLMLANRTLWLKSELARIEQLITDLTNGAPGALDTLNELAAALGDDPNFAATVLAELAKLKTPVTTAIADNAALDAVAATSVLTAAQGVLNPPLAIGGTIEHTELSDGSAVQKAYRITPAGVFLTKHIRTRRIGVWSAWTADGPDIGDLLIQTQTAIASDRFEANGAVLNRSSYADLFDRMGTVYGAGDGATTFGTLDTRGEFLRGWDNGRGIDAARALGSFQDFATEVLFGKNNSISPNRFKAVQTPAWDATNSSPTSFTSLSAPNQSVGLEIGRMLDGSETRPRNVAALFCIKF